jgi:hypothetical protein
MSSLGAMTRHLTVRARPTRGHRPRLDPDAVRDILPVTSACCRWPRWSVSSSVPHP